MAGIQQAFNQSLALFSMGRQMSRQTKALEASTPAAIAERQAQAAEMKYDLLKEEEVNKTYKQMTESELRGELDVNNQALGYLTEAYEVSPTRERASNIQTLTELKHEKIKDIESELKRREEQREKTLREQKQSMELRKQILSGTPYDFMRNPKEEKL